jgi:hypothetical protein
VDGILCEGLRYGEDALTEGVTKGFVSGCGGIGRRQKDGVLDIAMRLRGVSAMVRNGFLCVSAPLRDDKSFWKRVSRSGAETQSFPEELADTAVASSPRGRVFDRLL